MKYLKALLQWFFNEMHGSAPDSYVPIAVKPKNPDDVRPVTPELRELVKEHKLDFGANTERYLRMAVDNHPVLGNQIKWLRAVDTLSRNTKKRWMLENTVPLSSLKPAY